MRSGERLYPWKTQAVAYRPVPFRLKLHGGRLIDADMQSALLSLGLVVVLGAILALAASRGVLSPRPDLIALFALIVVCGIWVVGALCTYNSVRVGSDGVCLIQRRFLRLHRRIFIVPDAVVVAVVPCRFSSSRTWFRPHFNRRWNVVMVAEVDAEADHHVVVCVQPDEEVALRWAGQVASDLESKLGVGVQRVHADQALYEGRASRLFAAPWPR